MSNRNPIVRSVTWRLAVILAAAASAGLTSCPVEQAQELIIYDMLAETAQLNCQIRPNQGESFIRPNGKLDLSVTNTYWLFPRMKNVMPTISEMTGEGPQNLVFETNRVTVSKAHVVLDLGLLYQPDLSTPDTLFDKYVIDGVDSVVATTIDPNGTGAVAVQAIPPELANRLASIMVSKYIFPTTGAISFPAIWITAYVQVAGQTQDRWEIQSNVYAFAIELCWSCLIRFVTDDPTQQITASSVPCLPGQDDPVDNNYCPLVALYSVMPTLLPTKWQKCQICHPQMPECPYAAVLP